MIFGNNGAAIGTSHGGKSTLDQGPRWASRFPSTAAKPDKWPARRLDPFR